MGSGYRDDVASYELGDLRTPFSFPVGIPLQIEIEGVALRMASTSVGYLADKYLVIQYPPASMSISGRLSKRNRIVVRYLSGGTVFGFESELLAVVHENVNALFLSYPRDIARKVLRRSRRLGCHLPAKILCRGSDTSESEPVGEGVIVDISRIGCGLTAIGGPQGKALMDIRMGETVILNFPLPGMAGDVAIQGEVKRIEQEKERTKIGIGFEKEETLNAQLQDYISVLEETDLDS